MKTPYKQERQLLPSGVWYSHGDGMRVIGYNKLKKPIYEHVDVIISVNGQGQPTYIRSVTHAEKIEHCI